MCYTRHEPVGVVGQIIPVSGFVDNILYKIHLNNIVCFHLNVAKKLQMTTAADQLLRHIIHLGRRIMCKEHLLF